LDLPAPWEAVASAKKAFKQDKIGKICTFSPCIEQISRTVTALSDNGFVDIQMYECLIRFNEIRVIPMWTIEEAMEKQRAIEKKRKRALPRVLRESADSEQEEEAKKVKIESADDSNTSSAVGTPSSNTGSEMDEGVVTETPSVPSTPILSSETASPSTSSDPRERIDPKNVMVTRLPVEQRGHTSYLLFATFTPATQPPNLTQQNAAKKA
jgi:tRNA (adenine57-N1/adenine58-N1)-methyltransferase